MSWYLLQQLVPELNTDIYRVKTIVWQNQFYQLFNLPVF